MSEGPASTGPLQIDRIFAALMEHGVEFLVIGGVAVAVHGYPRGTDDVDIIPNPAFDNLERLYRALVDLDARPLEDGEFRPEEMAVELSVNGLRGGGNWCLVTRFGRLDVLQYVPDVLEGSDDYRALFSNGLHVSQGALELWIVGFQDLLRFKYAAGRDLDLVDIRALLEAHGDTGP